MVWQDEVSTQGRSGHYRLMVADAENRLVMLEANKSMLITRSGAYQTGEQIWRKLENISWVVLQITATQLWRRQPDRGSGAFCLICLF